MNATVIKPVKGIRVTQKGEQSAAAWVKGVLDGSGSSPAQIIVAVVIGCIPFVGQGVDVGNVIVSLVKIAEQPNNKDNWLDLIFNIVAFIPGIGDGLKIVFKQLRARKAMGAILDAIPDKTLRGKVDRWFKNLNWEAYTKELQGICTKMTDGLINVFDSWLVRAVLGQARLKTLVSQLRQVKKVANQQISAVMKDLKANYKKAIATPYPNTTAKAPITPKPTTAKKPKNISQTPAPKTQQKDKVVKDTTGNNANTGVKNTSTKRRQKRRSNQELGSGGEHITDYYYVKRKKNRSKINHQGVLYEYFDKGHNGIDHVWYSDRLAHKYRITDSKATNAHTHRTLMTPKAVMKALRMGLDVYMSSDEDEKVKRSVGTTVSDGVQMSHLWISRKISSAKIIPAHDTLIDAIDAWERVQFKAKTEKTVAVKCPYDRSLVTITGNLFDHHESCKGLDEPKCTRTVTAHAVRLEFILPNEMLER